MCCEVNGTDYIMARKLNIKNRKIESPLKTCTHTQYWSIDWPVFYCSCRQGRRLHEKYNCPMSSLTSNLSHEEVLLLHTASSVVLLPLFTTQYYQHFEPTVILCTVSLCNLLSLSFSLSTAQHPTPSLALLQYLSLSLPLRGDSVVVCCFKPEFGPTTLRREEKREHKSVMACWQGLHRTSRSREHLMGL